MITLCPSHTNLERWCHMNNNSSLLVPHEVHPLICFNHNVSSSEIHFVVLLSSRISGYLLNSSFQEPDFTALQGTDTVHRRKLSRKLSVTALVFYLFVSFFCTLHTTSGSIAKREPQTRPTKFNGKRLLLHDKPYLMVTDIVLNLDGIYSAGTVAPECVGN